MSSSRGLVSGFLINDESDHLPVFAKPLKDLKITVDINSVELITETQHR